MKAKVLLVLAVFVISIISASCSIGGEKIDVEKYQQKVRETRKGSATMENKKAVEKAIFPNLKDDK